MKNKYLHRNKLGPDYDQDDHENMSEQDVETNRYKYALKKSREYKWQNSFVGSSATNGNGEHSTDDGAVSDMYESDKEGPIDNENNENQNNNDNVSDGLVEDEKIGSKIDSEDESSSENIEDLVRRENELLLINK
jgi:hypothetical protein